MNRAEIVILTVAAFENSFLPGDRANLDWVTKCLYEYQSNPEPNSLFAELQQDIVWGALEINPNVETWNITPEEYELALTIINPVYARIQKLKFKPDF